MSYVIDWPWELEHRIVSQRELAEAAHLQWVTVSRIVTGRRRGRAETIRRLIAALRRFPVQLAEAVDMSPMTRPGRGRLPRCTGRVPASRRR